MPSWSEIEADARASGLLDHDVERLRAIYDPTDGMLSTESPIPKLDPAALFSGVQGGGSSTAPEPFNARVAAMRGEMQADAARSPVQGVKNALGAGFGSFVDATTFGYVPKLLDALQGGHDTRAAIEAGRQEYPATAIPGQIAGYLKGPGGKVLNSLVGGVTARVGTQALADSRAAAPFAQRAATQMLNNLVGGTTAATATTMAEASDRSFQQRLTAAWDQATSPGTLALTAGLSGLGALATKPRPNTRGDVERFLQNFKSKGGKVDPATALDDEGIYQTFSALRYAPGFARDIHRFLQTSVYGPMRSVLSDMRGGQTRESTRAAVAGRVREIVGRGKESGQFTAQRRGITGAAAAQEVGDNVSPAVLSDGVRAMQSAYQSMSRELGMVRDAKGNRVVPPQIASIFRGFMGTAQERAAAGQSLRKGDVFELHEALRKTAFAQDVFDPLNPAVSDVSRRLAGKLYDVTRGMVERDMPLTDRALRYAERIRGIEKAYSDVRVDLPDDAVILGLFRGDVAKKIGVFNSSSDPQTRQALRGWYMARLFEKSVNPETGMIAEKTLRRLLSSDGPFNSQVANQVLGRRGVRDLLAGAEVSSRFQRGLARAEGSPTASRAARIAQTKASTASVAAMIVASGWYLSNPFIGIAGLLGAAGTRAFMRSLWNGGIGDYLVKNAGRAGFQAGPMVNAIQQAGGPAEVANGLGTGVVGAASSAAAMP